VWLRNTWQRNKSIDKGHGLGCNTSKLKDGGNLYIYEKQNTDNKCLNKYYDRHLVHGAASKVILNGSMGIGEAIYKLKVNR